VFFNVCIRHFAASPSTQILRTSVITCEAEQHSVSVVTAELSGRKKQTTEYLFALKNWGLQRCQ
jgi:hypothetical protein